MLITLKYKKLWFLYHNFLCLTHNVTRHRRARARAAQYSRIENGKTDSSFNTLTKIAKALGVSMAKRFTNKDLLQDVNFIDTTLMEPVALIDSLPNDEQKTICSIRMHFSLNVNLNLRLKLCFKILN